MRDVGSPLGVPDVLTAAGITEMVDETMSNAARVHAVEQGKAANEHSLIAFGGAAPLRVRAAWPRSLGSIVYHADRRRCRQCGRLPGSADCL